MTQEKRRAVTDLILAGLVICAAIVLFIGAAELPPPRFDPMGSAAMPRILGGIMIALAFAVGARGALRLRAAAPAGQKTEKPETHRGAIVFVGLVAYVAALDFGRVPFVVATTLFVMLAGMAMGRFSIKQGAAFGALGLILSLVLNYVFAHFLYIKIG